MPKDQPAAFPDTRWSLVLRVQDGAGGSAELTAQKALEEICASYWYPLYAFARRAGEGAADAEDLTQGFFALLVSRSLLQKVERERGRLRSFLIGTFKLYMSEQHRRENRLRRGGGQTVLSLDQDQAEAWLQADSAADSPEERFDRDWAESIVALAVRALEEECVRKGRHQHFARLRSFLNWDQGEPEIAAAARDLGLSEGALRVAVHRLRHDFRRQIEAQVAQTVTTPEEMQAELDHLFRTLLRE